MKPSDTLIKILSELFPGVFTADSWRAHKPLARGIDSQLIEVGVLTAEEAEAMLRAYCRRRMYLQAVASGGFRFNLDGTVAGEVSAENIAAAKGSLAAMDAKQARSVEAAKAVREAGRAPREADQAAAGREFIAARRAARKAAEPPRLSLADLKAAAQARKAAEAQP